MLLPAVGSVFNFLQVYVNRLQVAKLSGKANNTSKAGVFYWNLNNDSANDNVNIGSQLYLFVINFIN